LKQARGERKGMITTILELALTLSAPTREARGGEILLEKKNGRSGERAYRKKGIT